MKNRRRFSCSEFTFKTFFGSHIYNIVMHMRDVFLCGAMRGSSVGNHPIKVRKFPNVFSSRIQKHISKPASLKKDKNILEIKRTEK